MTKYSLIYDGSRLSTDTNELFLPTEQGYLLHQTRLRDTGQERACVINQ